MQLVITAKEYQEVSRRHSSRGRNILCEGLNL
jgi:hypothetical protein